MALRSGPKPKSRFSRIVSKIPLFISYGILMTTWFGFTFVISVREVLVRRGETWHFAEQVIIANILFGLSLLSLLVASTRPPGSPDQTFAPHLPKSRSITSSPSGAAKKIDDHDIPLRYLRNSQWVTSHGIKDRPSPLPLSSLTPGTADSSSTSSERTDHGFGMPAVSPFPFVPTPFMPSSAVDAGEDLEEIADERKEVERVEGAREGAREGDGEMDMDMDVDTDRLLPSKTVHPQPSLFAKSNTGGPRWCKKCEGWKPDRCHHCRYCQQCVLKMDHHCVWVGTCVGFHNYKPFLLFVSYGTLLSIYIALEAGYESYRFFQQPDVFLATAKEPARYPDGTFACPPGRTMCPEPTSLDSDVAELDLAPLIFMLLAILGMFFGLCVGSLAGYHWSLAWSNMTTLENITHSYPSALLPDNPDTPQSWKPDHLLTRLERYRLRREASEINVYNLGWRRNLRGLLIGQEGKLWRAFWPMAYVRSRNDAEAGHSFEYDEKALERLRVLTRELRYETAQEEDQGSGGEEDGHGEDGSYEADEEVFEEKADDGEADGGVRGGVPWFEK